MSGCDNTGHRGDFVKFHLLWNPRLAGAFSLLIARNGTGIAAREGTSKATK